MKRLAVCTIGLMSLLPGPCAAQRAGFHGGGGSVAPRFGANFGLPPVGPIPPIGPIRSFNGFRPTFSPFRHESERGFDRRFGSGFPGFYAIGALPDYNAGGYEGYQSQTIVMPSFEPCTPTIPEPPPARPELHEYKWKETGTAQSSTFTIVLRDGSARPAVAVWVQGKIVHYIRPDDTASALPLYSIDRDATRRANAENHLSLQLPGENNTKVVR